MVCSRQNFTFTFTIVIKNPLRCFLLKMLVKIATASQAYVNNKYHNLKQKLLKCNANVFFNKNIFNKHF